MKGLEMFSDGTGSHAVATHLHLVLDHARSDLRRAPEHQKLLVRNIAYWLDAVHGPHRRLLDRAAPAAAVNQFSHLPAPASVTGITDDQARPLYSDLRTYRWLTIAAGTGIRRHYRTRIGDPFGVTATTGGRR